MKQKIKVQLDFNITKKLHSLSHSFFNNPPEGVEYKVSEFKGVNEKTYSTLGKIRKKLIKVFPFMQKLDQTILSRIRKEPKEVDLIHFVFHLGKTNKKCVVDYEQSYNFIHGSEKRDKKEKKKAIRLLKKGNIKYLMPINNESLKSFKLFFGDKIKVSQEVIYPTIEVPKHKNYKKKKRVIFIGSSNIVTDTAFAIKGGYETLLAFNSLSKKYEKYEFFVVSNIPEGVLKNKEKNLIIKNLMSQENLWRIMEESSIFVQPNYHTPAMAFIEAMGFKLPIVTYSLWANREYVEDKKNGLIIVPLKINQFDENNVPSYPQETIEKIIKNAPENAKLIEKAIEKLIKNPKLAKKMGEEGYKKVKYGKFSIKERNKKLRKIYEEALK